MTTWPSFGRHKDPDVGLNDLLSPCTEGNAVLINERSLIYEETFSGSSVYGIGDNPDSFDQSRGGS